MAVDKVRFFLKKEGRVGQKDGKRRGFTIIEVVLVLAIAGLIFAMVFVALPAMQRSQRDTQRKQDVQRVLSAVEEYRGRNKGQTPWSAFNKASLWGAGTFDEVLAVQDKFIMSYIDVDATDYKVEYGGGGSVALSYRASGCTDAFRSPNGNCYSFYPFYPFLDDAPGDVETFNIADELGDELVEVMREYDVMMVMAGGKCGSMEGVVDKAHSRNAVAIYQLMEGGSFSCVDNV